MGYKGFIKSHDSYYPQKDILDSYEKLEAGFYNVNFNPHTEQFYFESIDFKHDELLELPSEEFQTVSTQIDRFLTDETKQLFQDYGYLYKRSILMHGVPGTGKTCLVNRIAKKVVREGGIVFFNPHPDLLEDAYKILNDTQPETNVVVIFEELDQLMRRSEGALLNILDGEIQRENVIYLATTNFINQITPRIMRPGRFSSVVEVKYPNVEARAFYLNHKMGNLTSQEEIKDWAQKTDGLSIDELKEVVLSTKCLEIPLEEVLERINGTKELIKTEANKVENKPNQVNPVGFDPFTYLSGGN